MKLNKLYIGLLGMLVMALAACSSDDDYQRASVSGAQVYFPNTLGATIETSTDASSFTVPVYRVNTAGALTVPLNISMEEGSIYTPAASQVAFADGSNKAELTFTYDPSKVVYGDYYDITVAINSEGNTTDYGVSTYNFKAGLTAWVDMDGTAQYREDCITTFFGVGNDIMELAIQKNVVTEGIYRLVNPYGEAYPYNEPGDWDDTQDYYLTVNASDPDAVYVELSPTGMDWGYGMFSIQSLATLYESRGRATIEEMKVSNPEYFGTLKDGIITMPARSLVLSMADYNEGGWYTSNGSGLFCIALPGSRIADYSVEFTYLGRLTDASGDDFIRGKFKLGKDIYSVKYAVGPASEDAEAVVEGIIAGTVEADEMKRADAEPFEVAMDGVSGKYNLVVVVYDSNGEAVSSEAFEIKYQSSKDTAETWSAVYVGDYLYGAQSYSQSGGFFYDESPFTDSGLILYQSDSDATRYRIAPWCNSEEVGLVFTLNEDNTIVVEDVETGEDAGEYGMVMCSDFKTYGAADMDSYYEDGVFHFLLVYHVPAGVFAYEEDTFTLTGYASAPANRAQNSKKHIAPKSDKTIRRQCVKKADVVR